MTDKMPPWRPMSQDDTYSDGWAKAPKSASLKQEQTRPTNPAPAAQPVRQFDTGATRDIDTGKHDPEGFLSPLVIERFNEYMHQNRYQKDGSIRDSDNWQRGIPKSAYMKSLWRHFMDTWHHHRQTGKAKETLEAALCGVMFNAMGYLHELLKEKYTVSMYKLSDKEKEEL